MRIEVARDEFALAEQAANIIAATVREWPDAVLALPTGNTPIGTYAALRQRVADGELDLSRATVVAIDEFVGVTRATPGTNSCYYRDHLDLRLRALRVPDPAAEDPEREIRSFAESVRAGGGITLCVLGVGANGHIAFNEPGSAADSRARVVELQRSTREAHAADFGSFEAVPDRAMTLGVADLLEARAILVLASGIEKADIVARALEGPMTADVPASFLQSHADVTFLLDRAASASLSRRAS